MPELPEVETIRRDLQGEVVNRKIKTVEVRNGRTVGRHSSAKAFRAQLEGRTITAINRAGTYLLLVLDDGATLVVHHRRQREVVAEEQLVLRTWLVRVPASPGSLGIGAVTASFGRWSREALDIGPVDGERARDLLGPLRHARLQEGTYKTLEQLDDLTKRLTRPR